MRERERERERECERVRVRVHVCVFVRRGCCRCVPELSERVLRLHRRCVGQRNNFVDSFIQRWNS